MLCIINETRSIWSTMLQYVNWFFLLDARLFLCSWDASTFGSIRNSTCRNIVNDGGDVKLAWRWLHSATSGGPWLVWSFPTLCMFVALMWFYLDINDRTNLDRHCTLRLAASSSASWISGHSQEPMYMAWLPGLRLNLGRLPIYLPIYVYLTGPWSTSTHTLLLDYLTLFVPACNDFPTRTSSFQSYSGSKVQLWFGSYIVRSYHVEYASSWCRGYAIDSW